MNDKKIILSGMSFSEIEKFIQDIDEPKFRAQQLHYWLYKKCVSDFDKMTSLSKLFRAKLNEIAQISTTNIKQKLVGKDGTIKYLLEFPDGNTVETVLMRFDKRPNLTACISSQIGCPVKCTFCATGRKIFVRNLDSREIVDQILTIQRDSGLEVTNIVYMGQGEPLLNYNQVIKSIRFINTELEIGIRRITVSTSGIVPQIYKLSEENRQLSLAISLHAPTHELRKQIIPIEEKYPIEEIMKSLHFLTKKTGRRVTIEYVLIHNFNDSADHARQVNSLLKGLNCNINLIPYNPVGNSEYKAPSSERVNKFRQILESGDKKVTVRLERGADILAACGQLNGNMI